MGDAVTWSKANQSLPRGTVGHVVGYKAAGKVRVRFPDKDVSVFQEADLERTVPTNAIVFGRRTPMLNCVDVARRRLLFAALYAHAPSSSAVSKMSPDLIQLVSEKILHSPLAEQARLQRPLRRLEQMLRASPPTWSLRSIVDRSRTWSSPRSQDPRQQLQGGSWTTAFSGEVNTLHGEPLDMGSWGGPVTIAMFLRTPLDLKDQSRNLAVLKITEVTSRATTAWRNEKAGVGKISSKLYESFQDNQLTVLTNGGTILGEKRVGDLSVLIGHPKRVAELCTLEATPAVSGVYGPVRAASIRVKNVRPPSTRRALMCCLCARRRGHLRAGGPISS